MSARDVDIWTQVFMRMRIFVPALILLAPAVSAQQWTVDDVPVGSPEVRYLDPEFLPGYPLMVFQDMDNKVWIARLDPATGLLVTETGRDILVDSNIVRLDSTHQGPEWGLDQHGWAVFYTKYDVDGVRQIWRAEDSSGVMVRRQLTFSTNGNKAVFPSINSEDEQIKIGFANYDRGFLWAAVSYENEAMNYSFLPEYWHPSPGSRWSPNTDEVFYPYITQRSPDSIVQVASFDLRLRRATVLSNDAGRKVESWGFIAPEYGNDLCVASQIEQSEIAIYRNTGAPGGYWTRVATLRMPPGETHRYIFSMEPLCGLRGIGGMSYFSILAAVENDNDSDGAMMLLGLGADSTRRFIRRVDEGAVSGAIAKRGEPETWIGSNEVFFYYNSKGRLRRCRTGLFIHSTQASEPEEMSPRMEVYPNPARDAVTIRVPSMSPQPVSITDLLGRVHWSGELSVSTRIDVTRWPSGTYILRSPFERTGVMLLLP